MTTLCL